jgi:hypothetical protein
VSSTDVVLGTYSVDAGDPSSILLAQDGYIRGDVWSHGPLCRHPHSIRPEWP